MKHITAAKYESEELEIVVNMRGRCIDGESIYLANVNATVLSGTDDSPSALISGSATVTNGTLVNQKIIGGLPGVIYELWIAVRTTLGNVYIDTMNLAITPDEALPPSP